MIEYDHQASYLGVPFCKVQLKIVDIIEKVKKHIASWKTKHLSFAGQGVLVKAVAQTIPTYAM